MNIRVIVCRIGQPPVIEDMENSLPAMQAIVGGYVQCVHLPDDLVLFCNEEGLLREMQPNRKVCNATFVGDFFISRTDGDELASIEDGDIETVKEITS